MRGPTPFLIPPRAFRLSPMRFELRMIGKTDLHSKDNLVFFLIQPEL